MSGSSESVCVRLGREVWRGSSLWSDELECASGSDVSQMHCLALRRCLFVLLPSLFQWHMSNMCWKVILDFIPGAAHISLGCGIVIKHLPVQNEGKSVTLLLVILHFCKPIEALYFMGGSQLKHSYRFYLCSCLCSLLLIKGWGNVNFIIWSKWVFLVHFNLNYT